MSGRINYIIATLLLVIFPISAIGMDISIHKCSHKGHTSVSFFYSEANKQCSMCSGTKSFTSEQINKKAMHSCCNKAKKAAKNSSDLKFKRTSCCSNTKVSLVVNVVNILQHNFLKHLKAPAAFPAVPIFINPAIHYCKKLYIKDIQYPLKEPIQNIISFIHFTTSSKGDGIDVPNLHSC